MAKDGKILRAIDFTPVSILNIIIQLKMNCGKITQVYIRKNK